MADNGWTVFYFPVLRVFGGWTNGEFNWEFGEFVLNGRFWLEEERKWEEIDCYEWLLVVAELLGKV